MAHVPAARRRRRCSLSPRFGTTSDFRCDDRLADRVERARKPARQLRVGVDLDGGSPLPHQGQETIAVDDRVRGHDPRELVEKEATVTSRQELDPRERITSVAERNRILTNAELPRRLTATPSSF